MSPRQSDGGRQSLRRRGVLASGAALAAFTAGCLGSLGLGNRGSANDGASTEADGGWRMPAGTAALTGNRPAASAPAGDAIVWERSLDAPAVTAPVVESAFVAVGAGGSSVVALDGEGVRWSSHVGNGPVQGVALGTDRVVAHTEGYVAAFRRDGGDLAWEYDAAAGNGRGAPTVHEDTVLVAAGSDVTALDAQDGTVLWRVAVEGAPSTVAVEDGIGAVTTRQGRLYAFSTDDGGRLASFDAPADTWTHPVVVDGDALVPTIDGILRSVDLATGIQNWASEYGEGGPSRPVAVLDDLALMPSPLGNLRAFGLSEGTSYWSLDGCGIPQTSPSVADGVAFLPCEGGRLVAVDAASGALLAQTDLPSGTPRRPAIDDGTVVVSAGDSVVAIE